MKLDLILFAVAILLLVSILAKPMVKTVTETYSPRLESLRIVIKNGTRYEDLSYCGDKPARAVCLDQLDIKYMYERSTSTPTARTLDMDQVGVFVK